MDGYFNADAILARKQSIRIRNELSKVRYGDGMALRYKPQGERWTLKSTDFKSDNRTAVAYQVVTAEASKDTTHMFRGKFGLTEASELTQDLLNDEIVPGNAPMDAGKQCMLN